MKLQLDRPQVLALALAFPELKPLQDQLRFGHRIELVAGGLSPSALDFLAGLYDDAGAALAGRAAQLRALAAALRRCGRPIVNRGLPPALRWSPCCPPCCAT